MKKTKTIVWTILMAGMLLMAACWRTDVAGNQRLIVGAAVLIAGGAGALMLAMGIRHALRRRWRAEKLFVLLFVPLSLGMMVVLPIFRAPDETAHLQRIWQISIGEWLPNEENGGVFYEPDNFLAGARDSAKYTLYHVATNLGSQMNMDGLVVSDVAANTGIYPVNNYFPQALGMAIARLFTMNRMAILYAARLAAWLVTFGLYYYAIRRAPAGKYLIMALALLPVMLQESASASADGMTCSANAAYLALITSLAVQPRRMSLREGAMLFALMLMVGTFKMLYFPAILLCLMIPAACFGSSGKKAAVLGGMLAVTTGAALAWVLLCKGNYVSTEASEAGHILTQLAWMLQNPLGFVQVLGRTIMTQFGMYVEWFVGKTLSWANVSVPDLLFWLVLGAFCLTAVRDGGLRTRMAGGEKLAIALPVVCAAVVFVALYVWQTPYAADTIIGVQGRYFIPVAPALYLAIRKPMADVRPAERAVCALAMLDICVLAFVFVQTVV